MTLTIGVFGNGNFRKLFSIVVFTLFAVSFSITQVCGDETSKGHSSDNESPWTSQGRISIHDLQFGPAVFKEDKWKFLGNMRSFNAGLFGERLTLMLRFSYRSSRPDTQLKFVLKLPETREYEETLNLKKNQGEFTYKFTIHDPLKFVGSGSLRLYYGFSKVDTLDFSIVPGA